MSIVAEKFSKISMGEINDLTHKLNTLDPELVETLRGLLDYLASTYGDKYEKNEIISFKTLRKDEKLGKGFNVGNAAKYCARYLTEGHSKSEIKTDLYKSIHYLIFELMRKKEIETKELPF